MPGISDHSGKHEKNVKTWGVSDYRLLCQRAVLTESVRSMSLLQNFIKINC